MEDDGNILRFSHEAMATVFEVLLAGENREYARQASQAVFVEIDRLERLLNRHDPGSDVSQINRLKPGESVSVSYETFECLQIASWLCIETGGAFDVAFGSRIAEAAGEDNVSDGTESGSPMRRMVFADSLASATDAQPSAVTPARFSVALREGVQTGILLDLGGIGKGYALDKSYEILEDWGIRRALIHGGTSTALAFLAPSPGDEGEDKNEGWSVSVGGKWGREAGLQGVRLVRGAISGSGTEVKGTHIIDPRTRRPAFGHRAAWVFAPSAAVADALSTAFMVMSTEEVEPFCEKHPELAALVITPEGDRGTPLPFGTWKQLGS